EAKKAFDEANVAGVEEAAGEAAKQFEKLKIGDLNTDQLAQFQKDVGARVEFAGNVAITAVALAGAGIALNEVAKKNAERTARLNALDNQIDQLQNATFDTNEQARQADMVAQNLQTRATMSWQQKMEARGVTPRGAGQGGWAESVAQEQPATIALG
ncbi:MAG: hypothetical protein EAZ74_05100, partial [Alphaproteobacteria bacterium]